MPNENVTRPNVGSMIQAVASRCVGNPWFWVILISLISGTSIIRAVRVNLPEPMPVLATIPEFSLIDQHDRSFGTKDLQGKVWIANFIFTRCPTVCPAFTEKMGEIQHRTRGLGSLFHLVSFSVDPDYDTPERLKAFATRFRASPATWRFLTGPLDEVKSTVSEGLKVAMGNDGPEGTFEGIFHGSHLVVVDRKGQIRSFIDANDENAVERAVKAAGLIANRGG